MRQTSLTAVTKSRRTRGITLIEMSVVVIVILIMAALVERNFAHVKDGLAQRAFISNLRAEVTRGRLQAIQDGQTVTMQYDPAGSQFTLSEPEINTDSNQTPQLVTDLQNLTSNPVHSLKIPSGVSFSDFKTGTTDEGNGNWQLHFYPEGKSDGGGIQILIGQQTQSLLIDNHGNSSFVSGQLPDNTNDIWTSGTYVQRTTS